MFGSQNLTYLPKLAWEAVKRQPILFAGVLFLTSTYFVKQSGKKNNNEYRTLAGNLWLVGHSCNFLLGGLSLIPSANLNKFKPIGFFFLFLGSIPSVIASFTDKKTVVSETAPKNDESCAPVLAASVKLPTAIQKDSLPVAPVAVVDTQQKVASVKIDSIKTILPEFVLSSDSLSAPLPIFNPVDTLPAVAVKAPAVPMPVLVEPGMTSIPDSALLINPMIAPISADSAMSAPVYPIDSLRQDTFAPALLNIDQMNGALQPPLDTIAHQNNDIILPPVLNNEPLPSVSDSLARDSQLLVPQAIQDTIVPQLTPSRLSVPPISPVAPQLTDSAQTSAVQPIKLMNYAGIGGLDNNSQTVSVIRPFEVVKSVIYVFATSVLFLSLRRLFNPASITKVEVIATQKYRSLFLESETALAKLTYAFNARAPSINFDQNGPAIASNALLLAQVFQGVDAVKSKDANIGVATAFGTAASLSMRYIPARLIR